MPNKDRNVWYKKNSQALIFPGKIVHTLCYVFAAVSEGHMDWQRCEMHSTLQYLQSLGAFAQHAIMKGITELPIEIKVFFKKSFLYKTCGK